MLQYCLWIHIGGKEKHYFQDSGYLWEERKEKDLGGVTSCFSYIYTVLLLKLVVVET